MAVRIKADLTTSILNNADKERSRRSYEALGLMETTAEGDDVKEEDQKRLALIELDDAAMEATLTKVQKAADEKTGKHFTSYGRAFAKHPGGGGSFERRTIGRLERGDH